MANRGSAKQLSFTVRHSSTDAIGILQHAETYQRRLLCVEHESKVEQIIRATRNFSGMGCVDGLSFGRPQCRTAAGRTVPEGPGGWHQGFLQLEEVAVQGGAGE